MIKSKQIDVEKEDGTVVKIEVKKPNAHLINKAQKIGAKVWTESVKDGLFTKVSLNDFMKENGIWDEQRGGAEYYNRKY